MFRNQYDYEVFTDVVNRLKIFVLSYNFKEEEEEIFCFKEAKSKLCSRLYTIERFITLK